MITDEVYNELVELVDELRRRIASLEAKYSHHFHIGDPGYDHGPRNQQHD